MLQGIEQALFLHGLIVWSKIQPMVSSPLTLTNIIPMETLRLQKKEKNIHLMLKTNILIESIDMSTITKPKSIISKPKQKTQS